MKSSSFKHLTKIGGSIVLLLLVGFGQPAVAQNGDVRESQSVSISTTEDGKVKLKVVQKKGNDETTFEKTYDSHEEMQKDPDLEKYGIDAGSIGFNFGGGQPKFFLHNGPGKGFWDDQGFDMSSFREMEERMRDMMKDFGKSGFAFGFDDNGFTDLDSLMKQFSFRNDNGHYFFNGEEITNIDSLREAMREQFGNFKFDFDFGDWGETDNFNGWKWDQKSDNDSDDVKVITRVKVMVRSAREEDKKIIGTDKMDALELSDISFYPNPSDGRFDVELDSKSDSPVQVIIVDANGNEVYNRVGKPSGGQYDFSVDLTKEGKGIYIMKLVQNDKALTKRVVIE